MNVKQKIGAQDQGCNLLDLHTPIWNVDNILKAWFKIEEEKLVFILTAFANNEHHVTGQSDQIEHDDKHEEEEEEEYCQKQSHVNLKVKCVSKRKRRSKLNTKD